MGYYECAAWFGVYLWEWIHVLGPLIRAERIPATREGTRG